VKEIDGVKRVGRTAVDCDEGGCSSVIKWGDEMNMEDEFYSLRIELTDASLAGAVDEKLEKMEVAGWELVDCVENPDDLTGECAIGGKGEEVQVRLSGSTFEEEFASISQMLSFLRWGLVGFATLVIIPSLFGIINTQYISVLERTRQIGLMRALGMRKREVGAMFRYEAAWVGVIGGLVGVAVSWVMCLIASPVFKAVMEEQGRSQDVIDAVPVPLLEFNPLQCLVIVLIFAAIAMVVGLLPARRAAKMDPIEALRTE
jgi:uncharacterized membrane protein YuzA (DUF378 family)